MELQLLRYSDNGESTLGLLMRDSKFFSYTLEDEHRDIKVAGDTRIPAGRYQIKLRKVLSGLTQRYRDSHSWFTWHLELQNVPGFKYVYIHKGNHDGHTEACILVGNRANNNRLGEGFIGDSTSVFKELYLDLYQRLEAGEEVWIDIDDVI